MIDQVYLNKKTALFADMGTGKTVSTLTAIDLLIHEFLVRRVLIIAPKRVATLTWPEEIAKWEHVKQLTFSQLAGLTLNQRIERVRNLEPDLHIVNRELVPWLVDFWGTKWPYDMVVIDESSSFKSHASQRFKSLRKVLGMAPRLVELTGTPTSKGLIDLWSQVYLLDQGERLGKTITQYRSRYFEQGYDGYSYQLRDGMEPQIHDRIKDICLTIENDRQGTATINDVYVELPTKARNEYAELEKEFLLEIEQLDDAKIIALGAASLTGKLLQFANGAVYHDDKKNWVEFHDEKLNAVEEIIDSAQGSPVLIAYNFKHDLARLQKRFPKSVVLTDENKSQWDAGKIPVLLAHPASAGHGLNLQFGGHIQVWFGLNWSLELYQQMNKRLDRPGQKKQVIIHRVIASDTVDENVIDRLEGNYKTQKALLDALVRDIKLRAA